MSLYHPTHNPNWWRSDVQLAATWKERQREQQRLNSKKLSKNRRRNAKNALAGISPPLAEPGRTPEP